MAEDIGTERASLPSGVRASIDPVYRPFRSVQMHQGPAAVLVVESDRDAASGLASFLAANDYAVAIRFGARQGRDLLERRRFDALILSAQLADGDGFALCRQLRRQSDGGILMLTAQGDDLDRIVGLESGADDCLARPFVPRELLARLRGIMRRRAVAVAKESPLEFGSLRIDPRKRAVHLGGVEKSLSSHLFALLVVFAENAGRVIGREELPELLGDRSLSACGRAIDVQVCRLRSLIEDDARSPRRLVTIRRAGYLFEAGTEAKA